jgi:NAD(P)-dependent dehydrogenase (short-subunit alcohol dehydrogenase family)
MVGSAVYIGAIVADGMRHTNGRVALVTGAGRGIGRAVACALAARGDRVMAVSRTESELRDLADETGVDYVVDTVATPEGCERIVEETRRRLGPVEILVNNAGVLSDRERPVWDEPPEVWHDVFATNLHGPFELIRRVAHDMIDSGFGRIVIVSSSAGEFGVAAQPAYCASRNGLLGLMRAVAQDVGGHGITCNAVLPGWTKTQMADDLVRQTADSAGISFEAAWADAVAAYPAQRPVDPREIAEVVAFLASDAASGINGEATTIALGGVW